MFALDPIGTLEPDWFDDQIPVWDRSGFEAGPQLLDPVDAEAKDIDGWSGTSEDERREELGTHVYASRVVYGVAEGVQGGATLDDFAWAN
jgi:hypothetical protein